MVVGHSKPVVRKQMEMNVHLSLLSLSLSLESSPENDNTRFGVGLPMSINPSWTILPNVPEASVLGGSKFYQGDSINHHTSYALLLSLQT